MRGLVPRIHIGPVRRRDVDGRNKCGHDEVGNRPRGHGVMAKRTMRAPDEMCPTPAHFVMPGLDPGIHGLQHGGMRARGGWVYIMTNRPNGTLYLGVTSDIARRA